MGGVVERRMKNNFVHTEPASSLGLNFEMEQNGLQGSFRSHTI